MFTVRCSFKGKIGLENFCEKRVFCVFRSGVLPQGLLILVNCICLTKDKFLAPSVCCGQTVLLLGKRGHYFKLVVCDKEDALISYRSQILQVFKNC